TNSAGVAGGAVASVDSNVVATGLVVDANYALSGGGIDIADDSAVTLTDSTITSNTATSGTGGGAAVDATSTLTSNSTDWGDKSSANDPDDVSVAGTTYAGIGADATFTCDGSAAECL